MYPLEGVIEAFGDCRAVLNEETLLAPEHTQALLTLLDHLQQTPMLDLQEQYVNLFDFRNLLSLQLFEHTFGDSRERGQAMVDLLAHYDDAGIQLQPGEMPDYMPVFLEYLSLLPEDIALKELAERVDTFAVLQRRLAQHDCLYATVFAALESLSPRRTDSKLVNKVLVGYDSKKITNKALDEKWREPAAFGSKEETLHFVNNFKSEELKGE